jgi:hypothetical protein
MEVTMSHTMLTVPTNLGAALRQVFWGPRVASPDLRDLNDRGLIDIGLTRRRTDFEAAKPFWP